MSRLRKTLVKFLYEIGEQSGCHRIPERSFFYKGHQFPVCARCTGVAVGQFMAVIIGFFLSLPVCISLFFLSIMGIDWGIQELNIKKSTNCRRFITGLLGGFGLFSIYISVWKFLYHKLSSL